MVATVKICLDYARINTHMSSVSFMARWFMLSTAVFASSLLLHPPLSVVDLLRCHTTALASFDFLCVILYNIVSKLRDQVFVSQVDNMEFADRFTKMTTWYLFTKLFTLYHLVPHYFHEKLVWLTEYTVFFAIRSILLIQRLDFNPGVKVSLLKKTILTCTFLVNLYLLIESLRIFHGVGWRILSLLLFEGVKNLILHIELAYLYYLNHYKQDWEDISEGETPVVKSFTLLVSCISLFMTTLHVFQLLYIAPSFVSTLTLSPVIRRLWASVHDCIQSIVHLYNGVDSLGLKDATQSDLQDSADDCCAICRERFLNAKILPCKHMFHSVCIYRWVETNPTCPVCRAPFPRIYFRARRLNQPLAWNRIRDLLSFAGLDIQVNILRQSRLESLEENVTTLREMFPNLSRVHIVRALRGTGNINSAIDQLVRDDADNDEDQ